MKTCYSCGVEKPITDFTIERKGGNSSNFHAGIIDLRSGACKSCKAVRAKAWREKRKEEGLSYKSSGKIKSVSTEDRYLMSAIRTRISNARQNIKRHPDKGFNITDTYMYDLWNTQKGICSLTGKVMLIEKSNPYSLSIDKIDPSIGYVEGNVQWVCYAANRAKGDLTMEQLIDLSESIVRTCRDYP
jgi:hypothetical protein